MAKESLLKWLKNLRQNFAWIGLPVIFLTSDEDTDFNQLLEENDAAMVKGFPVNTDELLLTINNYWEMSVMQLVLIFRGVNAL